MCLERVGSHSTIMNKLSALKKFYSLNGFTMDLHHPILELFTRASKRQLSITARPKAPLEPGHIIMMRQTLDFSNPLHKLFYIALNIQFFTCVRKSNLLPPSVKAYSPFTHLSRGDLYFVPGALIVTLPWTKTIQGKEDILTLSIADAPGSVLDPVGEYRTFIQQFPLPSQTMPAFAIFDGTTFIVLTQQTYINIIKEQLQKLNIPSESYSSNSIRRGGCTLMAQAGVPHPLIKYQGGWKSQCYQRYISVMHQDKLIPTTAMISHIDKFYGNK